MIRVNLTYNQSEPLPTILTFNTPVAAVMWDHIAYLYATSPNLIAPIVFTSSNTSVLDVKLKDGFWRMEYCGPGTATVTASQTGQTSVVRSVTVTEKAAPTGRIINVGGNGGNLLISSDELDLIPGDTVIIQGGDYGTISIDDIIVPDGLPRITIITNGMVRLINENSFTFRRLRNVTIDGCRVPGVKQALLVDGHNYIGVYWNNLNYVDIYGVELRNVYDTAWLSEGPPQVYDGTESSYQKSCRFINCKSDNAGAIASNGDMNVNETDKLKGLLHDFQFIGWESVNSSAGALFWIGAGNDIVFKDCIFDHINNLSNNHNGIIFIRGNGHLINNRCTNFQGNLIRAWHFALRDGSPLDVGDKTCMFYGNVVFCSRKYGAFEMQGFANYYQEGFSEGTSFDVFNNTVGNMNQNIPRVFTGTLIDNYSLFGKTYRVFNNIVINPVNPNSNNIIFTYGAPNPTGVPITTGPQQEWNNRVYYTLESADIDPASLATETTNNGRYKAISNSSTALFSEDMYGVTNKHHIGAIQANNIVFPTSIAAPTVPGLESQLLNSGTVQEFESFMIDCFASTSPVGIQNYDIEKNGVVTTTKGAYCRDGKQDPEYVNPNNIAWTAYTYRWRSRDWLDQVSDWTEPRTYATEVAAGDTEPVNKATVPTITKLSGGTLVMVGRVYTATASPVLVDTGIVIPGGHSARLIIDHEVGQGIFGWSSTPAPIVLSDIKAGISTNEDGTRYEGVTSGTRKDQRDMSPEAIISLYIGYNGDSWCEISYDGGKNWKKPGNSLLNSYYLGNNYIGDKYLVGYIPTDRSLSNPIVILYPEPYNA